MTRKWVGLFVFQISLVIGLCSIPIFAVNSTPRLTGGITLEMVEESQRLAGNRALVRTLRLDQVNGVYAFQVEPRILNALNLLLSRGVKTFTQTFYQSNELARTGLLLHDCSRYEVTHFDGTRSIFYARRASESSAISGPDQGLAGEQPIVFVFFINEGNSQMIHYQIDRGVRKSLIASEAGIQMAQHFFDVSQREGGLFRLVGI